MSEKDDVEATERDSQPDSDRDSDPPSDPKPAVKKAPVKRAASAAPAAPSGSVPSSRVGLFVVLALAAGGAAGYFGQIQQAKAAAAKADQAAPVGSNAAEKGPCGTWQEKICSSSGKESAPCQQAKDAAELLTPSTCTAGLAAMPATLGRLKAARASCDKLVGKLCADLPPGSETCSMVKEKTPSFPSQRCDEMLKHYDEVIAQLKQIDQQGGMHMGGPGGPGGPGGHGGPGPGPVIPPQ
ncbi:MAG TPA: hypothetical protein VEQ59_02715 [Polyangiaceae bacterium]|nr:hypothetical protein [Polyangiaceae bacterium]